MRQSAMLLLIPAMQLLMVLSACAGNQRTPVPEPALPAASDSAGSDSAFAGLPFPDAQMDSAPGNAPQKESSGQSINYLFDSLSPLGSSPSATVIGQSMRITASGGKMEYLLYRATLAGSEAVELQIAVTPAGSDCWFGLADYDSGRFEFTRIGELGTDPVSIADEKWRSPAGNVYFALVAFNGAQLTAGSYKVKVHSGDPVVHQMAETHGYESCSIITLDGRPGVFYYQGEDDSLYFAHATSARPAIAGDWVHSLVDGDDFPGLLQSATIYQGRPLIAYSTNGSGELRLAWSESSAPTEAADWESVVIDDGSLAVRHPSLCVADGQPAVTYFRSDPSDTDQDGIFGYIHYAFHSGTALASGWQNYKLASAGILASEASLAVINGKPAVAFVDSQNGKLEYLSANRAFPTSTAHWASHETGRSGLPGRVRLKECDGRPVLLYMRQSLKQVGYLWGLMAVPETAGDWLEREDAATCIGMGNNFDLLSSNDRVDIFGQYKVEFQDQNGDPSHNQFMFIKRLFDSSYEMGVDTPVYFEYQSSKTVGPGYCASMVEGQPAVAYLDSDGSKLMFGRIIY